ncbi:hypothetical protein [Bifidobacterium aquikefiricola]|uniref:PIN domain-containing protein n=1 Tax=Bifidobacterium aquikefiricola TaxID=3059038 RepID=A0AB39U8G0_9BIFI
MFQLYSSEDVYAETLAHIRDDNPELSGGQITAIRAQLQEIANEIKEYDCRKAKETFIGADTGDLHVHAATVQGQCEYLLTNDRKLYNQLSEDQLETLPYEVCSADEFFCLAAEASAVILDKALTSQLRYWSVKMNNPPRQYDLLERASCPMFALLVKRATMRKIGMTPEQIDRQMPLGSNFSGEMQSSSVRYLAQISENQR